MDIFKWETCVEYQLLVTSAHYVLTRRLDKSNLKEDFPRVAQPQYIEKIITPIKTIHGTFLTKEMRV